MHAATKGFVAKAGQQLEHEVYRGFEKDTLLDYLSSTENMASWAKKAPDQLKLFIVTRWTQQGLLREALALQDMTSPKAYPDLWAFYRTTLLTQLGQPGDAKPFLLKLVKKYPGDLDVLFLKSLWHAETQDYPAAISVLDTVIKKSSRFGKAYLQRGLLYLVAMSYDLALKDLARAVKHLPKAEKNYRQMALLQISLIHLKVRLNEAEAKKYIERAVKIDPDSPMLNEFYVKMN